MSFNRMFFTISKYSFQSTEYNFKTSIYNFISFILALKHFGTPLPCIKTRNKQSEKGGKK